MRNTITKCVLHSSFGLHGSEAGIHSPTQTWWSLSTHSMIMYYS